MSINIGDDRISESQEFLRHRMRRGHFSNTRFAHELLSIVENEDVLSGKEQIHPDLIDHYSSRRQYLVEDYPEMTEKLDKILQRGDAEIARIDPQSMKICFLLGAGSSKPDPSGIPTVQELLPDLFERAHRLDRDEVTKLAVFCDKAGITNIEDLLTAAQISEFCGRNIATMQLIRFLLFSEDSHDSGYSHRLRRSEYPLNFNGSSVAFVQDTLQTLFSLLSNRMLPAEPNDGHKAIVEYVKKNSNSSVITTNYDCCIDLAMLNAKVPFEYGIEFTSGRSESRTKKNLINFIKLHGSLNWFYCSTCQTAHLIDIQRSIEDYNHDTIIYPVIGICRNCGGQRRVLLVPPLAMKFDLSPPLHTLMGKAGTCFADADLIVVVGFSFADADLYISRMISKAAQGKTNLKILIIDPDIKVVNKIRRSFGTRIPNFKESRILGIYGDCSKVLPKFLSGEYRSSK